MRDPYEVLGIQRNATDEEIKKAYRKLSRIYHPDANINNPNKDQAEAKFKEVQEAYRRIMDAREHGDYGYSGYSGYGGQSYTNRQSGYRDDNGNSEGRGYSEEYMNFEDFFRAFGFGGFDQRYSTAKQNNSDPVELQAAANYINAGHYREALTALSQVPEDHRNGKWYFYSAVAHNSSGNNITAMQHIDRAIALEPANIEYKRFKNMMTDGTAGYRRTTQSYGTPVMECNNCCCRLMMFNLLCSCCCGGNYFCCPGGYIGF